MSSTNNNPLSSSNLFSVKGKVILATGGSRGIGKMIAEGFAANGASKIYICSRKKKACDETAEAINKQYGVQCCVSLPADLSNIKGVEACVAALEKDGVQKLHILINNAGATWGALYQDYPDEAWQKIMDLNVRSIFNLTQKLTPKLAAAASPGDPARVINIASVDGVRATQTYGPTAAFAYTVSKGAVIHLTHAQCRALSSYNITVNTISPGIFPSNMTKFMMESDSIRTATEQANPLKRNGTITDMAGTVLYLCSKAGAYTNGVNIVVDGGSVLHDASVFNAKM
jgi:NAD(P)-dependent dehydrogenase (short-subunit alcohol dehydrogenase family)